MKFFQIPYLLLSSFIFFFIGCSSIYSTLRKSEIPIFELCKFQPVFNSVLYTADVDVLNKHLSGLLLIKTMPDSSIRTVFTNEMGVKYFDFEFSLTKVFVVHYIIKQMNRKTVINTLHKDFEMMLMNRLNFSTAYALQDDHYNYIVFPEHHEFIYYILAKNKDELIQVERTSKRNSKVKLLMKSYQQGEPDSIVFSHSNFNFVIKLTRIQH